MWSDWLVFCDCGFQSVYPLMEDKRLMEASWWERLRGKLGLVLMGGAMLGKSLIQLSIDGWGCVPSMLFDLRPNFGGGNEDKGTLCALQESVSPVLCNFSMVGLMVTSCKTAYAISRSTAPWPCNSPLLIRTSAGNTETQFCFSLCGVSGSWCAQGFFEPFKNLW